MSFPRSLLVLLLLVVVAPSLTAQDANTEAYFRMVGGYFDVPPKEILILSEWRLPADEIPVVLFVARRASIPVDAVVAIAEEGFLVAGDLAPLRLGSRGVPCSAAGRVGSRPSRDSLS